MQRLTEQQRQEAAERVELAKRLARRFRRPHWMSGDEWQAEALLVLVEAVATQERNDNFEAHLCMRLRYRRMQLHKRRPRLAARLCEPVAAARDDAPCEMREALSGLRGRDGDMMRLRVMGSDWETLGVTYGCSGRTVRRWFDRVSRRLRKEHAQ